MNRYAEASSSKLWTAHCGNESTNSMDSGSGWALPGLPSLQIPGSLTRRAITSNEWASPRNRSPMSWSWAMSMHSWRWRISSSRKYQEVDLGDHNLQDSKVLYQLELEERRAGPRQMLNRSECSSIDANSIPNTESGVGRNVKLPPFEPKQGALLGGGGGGGNGGKGDQDQLKASRLSFSHDVRVLVDSWRVFHKRYHGRRTARTHTDSDIDAHGGALPKEGR
eukprot:scaffold51671_cov26-Tisochrysis_lutea.AAC.1